MLQCIHESVIIEVVAALSRRGLLRAALHVTHVFQARRQMRCASLSRKPIKGRLITALRMQQLVWIVLAHLVLKPLLLKVNESGVVLRIRPTTAFELWTLLDRLLLLLLMDLRGLLVRDVHRERLALAGNILVKVVKSHALVDLFLHLLELVPLGLIKAGQVDLLLLLVFVQIL